MSDQTGNGAGNGNAAGADEKMPSLGVNGQYIKDLSFENPNVIKMMTQPGGGAPEVGLNMGVQAISVAPEAYEVTLSIRAEAKRDGVVAFIVELAYAGIFTLSGMPLEQIEPILFIEAPRLLFPFARAIISDVTRDGGFTPLTLNPIDFVDLYRRKLSERQAQVAAAPTTAPN